jgi:hypothetical protein
MTYHLIVDKTNTTSATSGTGNAYPPETSEFYCFSVGNTLIYYDISSDVISRLIFSTNQFRGGSRISS